MPSRNNAEFAKKACERPHDPARHRIEPQRQSAAACRNYANRWRCLASTSKNAHPTTRDDQQTVKHDQNDIHFGENAHFLQLKRPPRVFDRFFRIIEFFFMVREHLD